MGTITASSTSTDAASGTGTGTGPRIWVPGDWNAFFGFGTNSLVNMLTLTALLRYVLKLPDYIVFVSQCKSASC